MLSRERGVYALSSGKLFSLSIAIVIRSSCRPLLANAFTQVATPRHRKTFATVAKRKTLYEIESTKFYIPTFLFAKPLFGNRTTSLLKIRRADKILDGLKRRKVVRFFGFEKLVSI